MTTQQAQQLAAEAEALCDSLAALACDAQARRDWTEAGRVLTVRRAAVRRWERRARGGTMSGTVTQQGVFAEVGAAVLPLPVAKTTRASC